QQLQGQMEDQMQKLNDAFASGTPEQRKEVIEQLAHNPNLDPRLKRSLLRYVRILRTLYDQKVNATTEAERETADAKIQKETQRAANRAKKDGAEVPLLVEVEKQTGDP